MKRFNINEFVWFVILASFTLYTYYLISTGTIFQFIHPNLLKYTVVSFVILGELTVFQLFNIFKVKTRTKLKKGYLLFFLVIVVGIFIAPGGLNPEIVNKKGLTLVNSSNIENIGKHTHREEQKIQGNTIVFNEGNYVHYLEDISSNLLKHQGKKVVISGFVHKEDKLKEDEFILSRMLMNCCAADSQVLGILCEYKDSAKLEKNSWVRIEGKLGEKDDYPVIIVEKLKVTEAPENTFIYE